MGRLFQAKSRVEERRPAARVAAPEAAPPPAERSPAPASPSRPAAPPPPVRTGEGAAAEGETLAGRLLKRKRWREEDEL